MDFLRSGLRPSLRKSKVLYHKVTAILILFQLAIAICVNYNNEQKDIHEKLKHLGNLIDELSGKEITAEKFVKAIKKYTRVKKLTPYMLTELIEKIVVYPAEKVDGVRTQRLVIYYNCVGAIDIPTELPIPESDIVMNTRKGVNLTYLPAATA